MLRFNPAALQNIRDNRSNMSSTLYDFMREANDDGHQINSGPAGAYRDGSNPTTNLVSSTSQIGFIPNN